MRAWTRCAAAALAAGAYLGAIAWANHVDLVPRYEQAAPGAAVSVGPERYRLVSLAETAALERASGGADQAPEGTRLVVAVVEYTAEAPVERPGCALPLVTADGMAFAPEWPAAGRALPSNCDGAAPGRPWRYELVYAVPHRYPEVWGVGVDTDPEIPGGRPVQVLRAG